MRHPLGYPPGYPLGFDGLRGYVAKRSKDISPDRRRMMETEDQTFGEELAILARISDRAADLIRRQKKVVIASHVDADGLTSAGIISAALDRTKVDRETLFFKQLDLPALETIADLGPDLVIFTDLGSGMQSEIIETGLSAVVADHHRPHGTGIDLHVNPHLVGLDGATDLSGSGATFLLARAMAKVTGHAGGNDDLAGLAIVGAVGDLQDMANGKLVGLNRRILAIGVEVGVLSFGRDLKLFGKQTRAVFKMLEFSSDPYIPGLSGDEDACITFLKEQGIRLKGERWRRWIDMNGEEKGKIASGLVRRGLRAGLSNAQLERLVGEVYNLLTEQEGTELRDASEYSTLLNATARYGHSGVGLSVCLGDRGRALEEARLLLNEHRQNLVNGLKLVKEEGIVPLANLQYFDAGDRIRETIVGIVAGMSFQTADRRKPILAFARSEDGKLKVSARGTHDLVRSGLNLAEAISEAAEKVGGVGGGHNVAAGATIPPEAREEFLEEMDSLVGSQLRS
jgi:single-stranded-DNA-specific exonuclease